MVQPSIVREPGLAFGLPVFFCAAMVFPLHLGWTGASVAGLLGYLAIAASLFTLVGVLSEPATFPRWAAVVPQAILSFAALALPAAVTFGLGHVLGPIDEHMDGSMCERFGAAEGDTTSDEANDSYDLTPDCIASAR